MKASANLSIEVLRQKAFGIFAAGVAAADPYEAVTLCLQSTDKNLQLLPVAASPESAHQKTKIHLIAFGKAACPMMKAALDSLPKTHLSGQAIAVTNYGNVQPVVGANVIGAGHPLPDEAGFNAAKLCANIAINAKADELVLVLVSGGGSALIPYPVESVTLAEKIRTTDLLIASGASINQINCVRKHLSQLKGGGLAKLIAPARCHALILSDVIGDDISSIASGPTVPDETTFSDAIDILHQINIWQQVPASVQQFLTTGQQAKIQETPKPEEPFFANSDYTLIGSNNMSLKAVIQHAKMQGFNSLIYSDKLCGEARAEADKLVHFAKNHTQKTEMNPLALVAGGETTVTIKGDGSGGRNQEMALAFAISAENQGFSGDWVFLSGGTDGRDGPTDAAGGMVDSNSLQRMRNSGMNPVALLENNDSNRALKVSQDLLLTGATGTNVADLQVLLFQP